MEASCGAGHWLALKASTITCWSGKLTGKSVVSPGISIVLCLMCTRGGDLGVLCVLYCGVLCLVCIVLLPVVLCTVLWFTLMCGVLCCVITGECVVGACRSMQCRQVEADICSTGSKASLLVLGTIQVLPSRCIMLLEKSCLMLLSLINVVPPMTGQ